MKLSIKYFAYVIIAIFAFTSCQKSYTIPGYVITPPPSSGGSSGSSGNGTAGATVVKIITLQGIDTISGDFYSYDASNRLINYYVQGKASNGNTYFQNFAITRNSAGNIIKFITSSNSGSSSGSVDSFPTYVHYPSGSSNFDYKLAISNFAGIVFLDSIVYVYNGNNILTATDYNAISGFTGYSKAAFDEYNYDGNGNLIQIKSSIDTSSTGTGQYRVSYKKIQYDNQNSPLNFGNDLILIPMDTKGKNNQIASQQYDANPSSTSFSSDGTLTLNYNSLGYPSTGTEKVVTKNPNINYNLALTFTYK